MIQRGQSKVILLLGSNIGEREHWLESAAVKLTKSVGCVIKSSNIYESEPWGFESNTPFLNQAVLIDTELGPRSLLHAIWQIEKSLGRKRDLNQYASRTIDIDILTWEDRIVWTRKLQVPHVQLQNRKFALTPLVELAPEQKHPLLNLTYTELLAKCNDSTWVKLFARSHV